MPPASRWAPCFLPLNTAYTPAEVDYFVTDSGARLLICDGGSRAALAPVAAKAGARLLTLNGDGSGTLADAANGKPDRYDPAERGADDLAAFLYTSGTTGRSKGAMLTHDNLLSNAEALVETWRFTADDVLLHALPIFHTHGLFVASNVMLLAGGSMIFLPALDVDDLVTSMAQGDDDDGRADLLYAAARRPAPRPHARRPYQAVRFGQRPAARRDPCRIRGPHRPKDPRALRHDRDQHEHVEPL